MSARTKKHPTDRETVPLCFLVHPRNIARIRALVAEIEPEAAATLPVSTDEFFVRTFPGQSRWRFTSRGCATAKR